LLACENGIQTIRSTEDLISLDIVTKVTWLNDKHIETLLVTITQNEHNYLLFATFIFVKGETTYVCFFFFFLLTKNTYYIIR